jgi:hypothetical protein
MGGRAIIVTAGARTLRDARVSYAKVGDKMIMEMLLLALIAIGVFGAVWELEQIRQILNRRP